MNRFVNVLGMIAVPVAVICGLAGFSAGQTQQKTAAISASAQRAPSPSSEEHPGRYQLVINPNGRVDTFLIDTETGKTWQRTQLTDLEGEPEVWLYRDRIDDERAELDFYSRRTTKSRPAPAAGAK